MPHDIRDEVIDYVRYWSERTELATTRLVGWVGISRSKYYGWRSRYGKVNEHNAWIPRDFWLEEWEKEAIVRFHQQRPRIISDNGPQLVARFVEEYNSLRLHSAIGYITPKDRLEGRADQIFAQRDAKLAEAREQRRARRRQQRNQQRDPLRGVAVFQWQGRSVFLSP